MEKKDRKKRIGEILLSVLLVVFPLLLGFLLSFFLKRKNLFESIAALFALVYLLVFLFRLMKKDNLVYRKGKYRSKEEYKESIDHERYRNGQLLLLFPILVLILSSVLIYFFYVL